MTWRCALGPYLWLPMSAKACSPGEPHGCYPPSQPPVLISGLGYTQGNAHPIHCRSSDHQNVAVCTHGWEVCRNQIHVIKEKFFQLCNIHSCYSVSEEAGWYIWSVISKELTSSQATSRPLPGTHCLFYQSLWCGRGCEIWRGSEEEI